MEIPKFPPIKFDLQTRFGSIYGQEERNAIEEVLIRDAPTSNKSVVEFERKFAEFCDTKYAISVSNGTAALMMAYKAINIKPGDEIITTAITWIATAAAAEVLGAKIRFADIDPDTFNIDPKSVESMINEKTKCICPVHLYGQPVDMDSIMKLAKKHNLFVIEDSAHAPGGLYKGKKTGSIGDLGCFSFHEQKNMSTLGEGGMITTNSHELYERARGYKSHCARVLGKSTKYLSFSKADEQEKLNNKQFWYQDFDDCGYNFRMNDVTAAVGLCQLDRIDGMNKNRNEIAQKFVDELKEIDGIKPLKMIEDVYSTYHLFPVIIDPYTLKLTREEVVFRLRMDYGIKTGTHYMPLVQSTAFKSRGYSEKDVPVACKRWKQLITLPIHPRLTEEAIDYLIKSIRIVLHKCIN